MWATLHTFEYNNLGGMTLIPAPKYGRALLGHGRDRELLTDSQKELPFHCFTEIPYMSAPNVQISNYGAGFAESVTTV
jgi:hypothetical protein